MKKIKIAIVGFGNIGSFLFNELKNKSKEIEIKTGKKISIVSISAKNINKKRKYKINKKIFFKNPLNIFKKKKIDILFELIGLSDGISKRVVQVASNSKLTLFFSANLLKASPCLAIKALLAVITCIFLFKAT